MKETYIITGPCAAETEQQVLQTADGVAACRSQHPLHTYIYRAGVWKPRTSPDTFQGVGELGLQWLQHVKSTHQLPVATEVATPDQTHLAIEAGIDYLWIGARTAANPIAVQAIADVIKLKTENAKPKGILVKNPVNEDAALWLGNIERLEAAGVPVMAVHRGCNHRPCWQMAYHLIQQRQDIPLLLDPSHMTGKASAITDLCVKAEQMGYYGYMIETHISPSEALSDASQQITPAQLEMVMTSVESESSASRESVDLKWMRSMIDEVDDDLWHMLAKRMDICRQIGAWKKQRQMSVVQPTRYQEILQKRIAWAEGRGIDVEAVEQIMEAIHKESVRVQS